MVMELMTGGEVNKKYQNNFLLYFNSYLTELLKKNIIVKKRLLILLDLLLML